MKKSISWQGYQIEYELTRKRVKNLNLRIGPDGNIRVSAPYFTPQAVIDRFILAHAHRIRSGLERMKARKTELADESAIILRGQRCEIRTVPGSKGSARLLDDCVLLTLPDDAGSKYRSMLLKKLVRELAVTWLEKSSRQIYPIFREMGVAEPELKFRAMKSRWGSCRWEKGSLSFNTALAHVPEECMDYVVMHEYCHFFHPNHSPAFHGLMTQLMLDWKERKKTLEKYSCLL